MPTEPVNLETFATASERERFVFDTVLIQNSIVIIK